MKTIIKRMFLKMLFILHHYKHERFYEHVMKVNGIKNCSTLGERKWHEKWRLGGAISVTQYRVFFHYIGPNVNIVPEEICHDIIEPLLNPHRFVGYYADKNVFDKLFPEGYMPKTLFRRMNGIYYDADYKRIIKPEEEIGQLLSRSATGRAIIKPSIDGMSGRGVQMIDDANKITLEYLNSGFGKDFIVQEAVSQSDYISQFNPTSVNTLRLSVYRSVKDDAPLVTGAIMRIGGKGSVVDNAHAGGCYVGIHSDGTFCHEVLDQYGQKRTCFNNIDFKQDFRYPNWEEVVEFGKSVCQYVPHHRLLALDIVLDKMNKPHLIEFNVLYFSTWLFQYTTGPAFGEYTDEILDYCKGKLKDIEYQLMI